MKKNILIISVIFLVGTVINAKTDHSNMQEGNKCEKFIADYEVWVNEVTKVYKKAKSNPMDMKNSKKLVEASKKMKEWSKKWEGMTDCKNNEKYSKKMEELQAKAEKMLGK